MDSKNTHVCTLQWGEQVYVTKVTNARAHCTRSEAYKIFESIRCDMDHRGSTQPQLAAAISDIIDWNSWKKTVNIAVITFADKSSAAEFMNTVIYHQRHRGRYNVLNEYYANTERVEGR